MNAVTGGNPTSWTVTCSDQDGDETVLSSVSPMDACTDSVSTGCVPVSPKTTYDMISFLPAPPTPPSPPAPPPLAPCNHFKVKTTLASFASEQSWAITGPTSSPEMFFAENDYIDEADVCLEPGAHTVCLRDSFGDGWSTGSSLTIEESCGGVNCKVLLDGATINDGAEGCFDFHSGAEPPSPPPLP